MLCIYIYKYMYHLYRTLDNGISNLVPKQYMKQCPQLDTEALKLVVDGSITIQSMIAPRE